MVLLYLHSAPGHHTLISIWKEASEAWQSQVEPIAGKEGRRTSNPPHSWHLAFLLHLW